MEALATIGWSLITVAAWIWGVVFGLAWSDRRADRRGEPRDRGYWP